MRTCKQLFAKRSKIAALRHPDYRKLLKFSRNFPTTLIGALAKIIPLKTVHGVYNQRITPVGEAGARLEITHEHLCSVWNDPRCRQDRGSQENGRHPEEPEGRWRRRADP